MPSVEDKLPPGTFAALQSVETAGSGFEVRTPLDDRVIIALTKEDGSTEKPYVRLQPIVWVSILHKLHTFGRSVDVTLLLNEIPTSFWHPTFLHCWGWFLFRTEKRYSQNVMTFRYLCKPQKRDTENAMKNLSYLALLLRAKNSCFSTNDKRFPLS